MNRAINEPNERETGMHNFQSEIESIQSNDLPIRNDKREMYSYAALQARYTLIVLSFWSLVFLCLIFKSELNKLKRAIFEYVFYFFIYTPTLARLNGYRLRFLNFFQNFNVTQVQATFRSFSQTLSSIYRFLSSNQANANTLAQYMFNSIKSFLILIGSIRASISAISSTFTFNIRRILYLPIRIKNVLSMCTHEIRMFWRQIEQIIQIIRLPIEFLALIGRVIKKIASFLSRIEKPKIKKPL
jgi:hypothetical protein